MRRLLSLTLIGTALGLSGALPARAEVNLARLRNDVFPTSQKVQLTLDPAKSEYMGSVHLELKASAKADSFQLNVRGLKLGTLTLSGPKGQIATTTNEAAFERLSIHPAQHLQPGAYSLDITFTNTFDEKATGLYRLKSGDDWYAFTQFEANEARQAFPCFDEPEFKIPWTVTLTVPKDQLVLANTPELSRAAKGEMVEVAFETSPPMPSYLVAFAAGPFVATPVPGMSVPARVITVKSQQGMTGEAVRMAPPLMAALERYFGRPYPFKKLDLISVPEYNYGAMENPGAITFNDRVLSLDPKSVTDRQRRVLAVDLAHEFAHMWFGDLVTMKWWDDLWLNESFAEWMGNKTTNEVYPEFNIAMEVLDGTARAYSTDNHLSTRAIRQKVDEHINLNQLADALAYQKGEAVLGMYEAWLGPEVFRKGVIEYLKTHAWGNAEGSDLWNALSKAAGRDLGPAMSTFLDQPGVPTVLAELMSDGQVRLSQQRFLPFGETAPSAQNWHIPVLLKFSDGKQIYTQRVLLTEPVMTVKLKPAVTPVWIHPNADEKGYYHWNVSVDMLKQLSTKARPELSERERAGLITNLQTLLEGGMLHGDDYLQSLSAFGSDPSPAVIGALLEGLRNVRPAFITADLREAYAGYIRRTLRPALDRLGDTPKPDEGPTASGLRGQLMSQLGVEGRDEALRHKGLEMTKAFLADPAAVDPTLVETAFRLAATSNDTTLYHEFSRRFEGAKSPNDRRRYLGALYYFEDPALVDETLAYSLTGPLKPQELLGGFRGMDSPENADKPWNWLRDNYDAIAGKIPPMFKVYLVYFAMGCKRERIEAAQTFFAQPERSPLGTAQELAKLTDRITECATLREREGARVAKMLTEMQAAQ